MGLRSSLAQKAMMNNQKEPSYTHYKVLLHPLQQILERTEYAAEPLKIISVVVQPWLQLIWYINCFELSAIPWYIMSLSFIE